jgi:ribosomal-protein-alanine N-acetyltransferase
MQIRTATAADIPAIMRIERQSATAGHWTEEQYLQAFQPGCTRLVLLAEDSPIPPPTLETSTHAILAPRGFLVAQHVAPEWELENIVVDPSARREGVGRRLLDALLAAAHETNSSGVFLEVRESNTAARTLYQSAGFEQAGRRKSYYTNPSEDAILYRLTVS